MRAFCDFERHIGVYYKNFVRWHDPYYELDTLKVQPPKTRGGRWQDGASFVPDKKGKI